MHPPAKSCFNLKCSATVEQSITYWKYQALMSGCSSPVAHKKRFEKQSQTKQINKESI